MGLESGLDTFLVFVLLLTSLVGLIRGFLKELASIVSWFGSLCLTSLLKPLIIKLFLQNFKFPFLVDIIANSALFVVFVLLISIVNRIVVEKTREYIPLSINSGLGFLFGFFKGVLIISVSLTCVNMVFGEKKPESLKKSIVNGIVDKNDGILTNVIHGLLGDFIEKKVEAIKSSVGDVVDRKNEDYEIGDEDEETEKNIKKIIKNIDKKKLKKKIDSGDLDNLIDGFL